MSMPTFLAPDSPIRSRRLQGAFIIMLMWGLNAAGIQLGDAFESDAAANLDGLVTAVATMWMFIGGIFASKSPRKF